METNKQLDFSIDKENKTIHVSREFDADLDTVWNAWTKSNQLDQWWAPKPWKAETKSMDFKEGGEWIYAMKGPDGETHWSKSVYTSINDQNSFSSKDSFIDENGTPKTDMPQNKWQNKFTEKDGKTTVDINLTFDNNDDLNKIVDMGFQEGFTAGLENLDELLEQNKM
jgi:PhnB protein